MPLPKSPGLATDCVVLDARNRLLVVRRKMPPFKGQFSLPGGFVEIGETVEDACRRELMEETSLKVGKLQLVGIYSDPKRDPRAHICTVGFLVRVGRVTPKAGDDAAAVEWIEDLDNVKLGFDHGQILADARRMLRKRR